MYESEILHNVFKDSPINYFKFLFGLENREMIHHYLSATHHWDAGFGTLINDSQNVIRVHSLIHFFSFGYVTIHIMVVAFFSLLASKFLFRTFRDYIQLPGNLLFWIFVLTPSILFWTSGILKEPFMFFDQPWFHGRGTAARARPCLDSKPFTKDAKCFLLRNHPCLHENFPFRLPLLSFIRNNKSNNIR